MKTAENIFGMAFIVVLVVIVVFIVRGYGPQTQQKVTKETKSSVPFVRFCKNQAEVCQ